MTSRSDTWSRKSSLTASPQQDAKYRWLDEELRQLWKEIDITEGTYIPEGLKANQDGDCFHPQQSQSFVASSNPRPTSTIMPCSRDSAVEKRKRDDEFPQSYPSSSIGYDSEPDQERNGRSKVLESDLSSRLQQTINDDHRQDFSQTLFPETSDTIKVTYADGICSSTSHRAGETLIPEPESQNSSMMSASNDSASSSSPLTGPTHLSRKRRIDEVTEELEMPGSAKRLKHSNPEDLEQAVKCRPRKKRQLRGMAPRRPITRAYAQYNGFERVAMHPQKKDHVMVWENPFNYAIIDFRKYHECYDWEGPRYQAESNERHERLPFEARGYPDSNYYGQWPWRQPMRKPLENAWEDPWERDCPAWQLRFRARWEAPDV